MSIPLAALAAAQAAPGLITAGYKFFKGGSQEREGKRLLKTERPTYTRPNEVNQALNLTERNYLNGMPGSDLAESRIGTSAAAAFDASSAGASSSGDVLDAATKINYNTNNALLDLGVQEQQFKQNALGGYVNQLGNSAGYADKEFSYNIDQPYQNKIAAGNALVSAGGQNKFAGVDDFAGAAASAASFLANPDGGGTSKPSGSMGSVPNVPTGSPNFGGVGMNMPASQGLRTDLNPNQMSLSGMPKTPSFNPATMGYMVFDPITKTYRMK